MLVHLFHYGRNYFSSSFLYCQRPKTTKNPPPPFPLDLVFTIVPCCRRETHTDQKLKKVLIFTISYLIRFCLIRVEDWLFIFILPMAKDYKIPPILLHLVFTIIPCCRREKHTVQKLDKVPIFIHVFTYVLFDHGFRPP